MIKPHRSRKSKTRCSELTSPTKPRRARVNRRHCPELFTARYRFIIAARIVR